MGWTWFWIGFLLLTAVITLNAFIVIPTIHYGVVIRFKKRTGRVISEGLHLIIPFIDAVELFESTIVTKDIEGSFFSGTDENGSAGRLEIKIKGSVQWSPDPEMLVEVFIRISEEALANGLIDSIKGELGIIAGVEDGASFIGKRRAINLLINCVLRLSNPPHQKDKIEPENIIQYYEERASEIEEMLKNEVKNIGDRSAIEELYGIDIVRFALSNIDFSDATKKALELKRQTEETIRAKQVTMNAKIAMTQGLIELGIGPREALNSAEVNLDQAKKKIFSAEGLGDLKQGPINISTDAKPKAPDKSNEGS